MPTIEEWSKRLSRLTHERLARECRARVVLKDLKGAYRHIIRLLERYDDDGSVDFRYFLDRKKSRRKLVKKMKLNHLRKRIEEMKVAK